MIVKKINDIFKERDNKMVNVIREAMFQDNQKIFKMFRKDYELKLSDLAKERLKLKKRKKVTKERMRLLRINTC